MSSDFNLRNVHAGSENFPSISEKARSSIHYPAVRGLYTICRLAFFFFSQKIQKVIAQLRTHHHDSEANPLTNDLVLAPFNAIVLRFAPISRRSNYLLDFPGNHKFSALSLLF